MVLVFHKTKQKTERKISMKCIEKHGEIKRVEDRIAENLVIKDGWKYCSKSEWKKDKKK